MKRKILEVECDAPRYEVVKACKRAGAGLVRPEDVRWLQMKQLLEVKGDLRCRCSGEAPVLILRVHIPTRFTFVFVDGHEEVYYMAQCPRCNTIYWKPA